MPGDAIKWGPAPPSLPPGAQAAVLLGSPAKEGPFVLRLKFPAGFIVPPHRHSKDELVTVISGKFAVGVRREAGSRGGQAAAAGEFRPPSRRHAALRLGRRRDHRADQRHGAVRRDLRRSQGRSAQEVGVAPRNTDRPQL